MAGASSKRARKERQNGNDSNGNDKNGKSSDSPETQQASSSSESPPIRNSPPTGFDGNRDPTASAAQPMGPPPAVAMARNMDLGLRNSFLMYSGTAPTDLPPRPNFNNPTGRPVQLKLNTWHAQMKPGSIVHQYDVVIGSGDEKRGLIMRVWESKTVQEALGPGWIFDGNKIAYSQKKLDQMIRVEVDLDKLDGKEPRKDKEGKPKNNTHVCRIRWAKQVPMQSLDAYMGQRGEWDVGCLEAMTFLDRLMRESPSRNLIKIKRNFYSYQASKQMLGNGIEAIKGVYVTIRPVLAQLGRPATLSVNADVANTTFWQATPLHAAAMELANATDFAALTVMLQPKNGKESHAFRSMRRLRHVRVYTLYNNPKASPNAGDEFVIDKVLPLLPREKKFRVRDPVTGQERTTDVEAYMIEKYGKRLQWPTLPLVKMTKGQDTCIPMELLQIKRGQRYAYKLTDRQTSNMLRFAVSVPDARWTEIENSVKLLDWRSDRYLQNYGLRIGDSPAKLAASLLPPPKVMFAQGSPPAEPRTSGRWDLRGKRFIEPHLGTLKSWGVCVVPGSVDKATAQAFITNFIRIFEGHGGKVSNKKPAFIQGDARDASESALNLFNAASAQSGARAQLLVFIVPSKDAEYYNRLKKSCDCRFGIVSQVLQSVHVQKNQAQYCSNVAMKVNAKLGGVTSRAAGVKGNNSWFNRPTMIIGADVSHGAPGSAAGSIAAVTVSWDRICLRYVAAVENNGLRVEMITKTNWEKMLEPVAKQWYKVVGGDQWPQHIIYLRDGVSEGQYSQVLSEEVKAIQGVFANLGVKHGMDYTVLTCTKRHHVRFFPDRGSGDRNNNPQPGTLVEQGVTDPRDWDFYLCAHSAIKGTARPVHYTVLRDDAKMDHTQIQNMIYEASYQYVRSTTPVSLHPAIYYAHLAALRAGSHYNRPSESSGQQDPTRTGTSAADEIKDLLPLNNATGIKGAMWYV